MWISKEADVRKQEFLDAALILFSENGYENTSINDILKKVGVTKGAYYYYFASKEEILSELSIKQSEKILNIVQTIIENPEINALEKINRIITDVFVNRAQRMDLRLSSYKSLAGGTGSILFARILENVIQNGCPLIKSILEQGVSEGIFEIVFLEDTAKLYIRISNFINSDLLQAIMELKQGQIVKEDIKKKLLFYENVLNGLLGIKRGRITLADTVLRILDEYKII